MAISSPEIAEAASTRRFLSVTIARVSLSEMDRCIQAVLIKIAAGRFQRSIGPLELSRIYDLEPPPGGAHLFKILLYSPKALSGYAVFVTNVADGWNSLCHLVAKEHSTFQIQLTSTKANAEFPQNRFEVWDHGLSKRVVMLMRDSDEWVFFQKGAPEGFENEKFYKKRIKKNRLTREIIFNYVKALGVDLRDAAFWHTSGEAIYFGEKTKTVGSS